MIHDNYTLQNCLLSFENALRLEYGADPAGNAVEYTAATMSEVIQAAKQRLEDTYQCRLDKPIYTVLMSDRLAQGNLSILMGEVSQCYQQLAAINAGILFTKEPVVSLADVNYLGFTSETLCAALKYFQDRVLYAKHATYVAPILAALDNVDMCQVKRLFAIMLLLESLGFDDVVAVCAQTLFLGGVSL